MGDCERFSWSGQKLVDEKIGFQSFEMSRILIKAFRTYRGNSIEECFKDVKIKIHISMLRWDGERFYKAFETTSTNYDKNSSSIAFVLNGMQPLMNYSICAVFGKSNNQNMLVYLLISTGQDHHRYYTQDSPE